MSGWISCLDFPHELNAALKISPAAMVLSIFFEIFMFYKFSKHIIIYENIAKKGNAKKKNYPNPQAGQFSEVSTLEPNVLISILCRWSNSQLSSQTCSDRISGSDFSHEVMVAPKMSPAAIVFSKSFVIFILYSFLTLYK